MGSKRTQELEIKSADLKRAALFRLALQSIGEDLGPIILGAGSSDDIVDRAVWVSAGEEHAAEAVHDLLHELARKLEALGVRALVFAATETRLDATFPSDNDFEEDPGAA